jgi:hypothetical protein
MGIVKGAAMITSSADRRTGVVASVAPRAVVDVLEEEIELVAPTSELKLERGTFHGVPGGSRQKKSQSSTMAAPHPSLITSRNDDLHIVVLTSVTVEPQVDRSPSSNRPSHIELPHDRRDVVWGHHAKDSLAIDVALTAAAVRPISPA